MPSQFRREFPLPENAEHDPDLAILVLRGGRPGDLVQEFDNHYVLASVVPKIRYNGNGRSYLKVLEPDP